MMPCAAMHEEGNGPILFDRQSRRRDCSLISCVGLCYLEFINRYPITTSCFWYSLLLHPQTFLQMQCEHDVCVLSIRMDRNVVDAQRV